MMASKRASVKGQMEIVHKISISMGVSQSAHVWQGRDKGMGTMAVCT